MKLIGLHRLLIIATVALCLVASGVGESAALTLPAIFSNNMVIQRDKPIHIWGKANLQEQIRVEFAGRSAITVAENGEWEVWLDPVAAGGPFELVVSGEGQQRIFRNVLVGDVWIASGQSNMVTNLQTVTTGTDATSLAHLQEAVKLANSQIRLFQPAIVSSNRPLTDYAASGWKVGSFEAAYQFSAVGFFFGGYLQQSLGVPIGIMQLARGGSPAQAWMPAEAFQTSTALQQIKVMTEEFEKDNNNKPAALYNGMIAPAHDFPVKGVIWYQGERNADVYKPADYSGLMTALINNWREKWHDPLPFLIVQLPAYGTNSTNWPELRDEQRKIALTNENVGLAVTIDTGDRNNIHPKNKMPVGYRLALQARCLVYGEDIVCSGPTIERAERVGDEVILSFQNIGSGLTSYGKELSGFRLCAANKMCAPAEAAIEGQQVVLWSSDIERPTTVSYAWSDFPQVSLFNVEGLPAAPFNIEIDQASGSGAPGIMVMGYPVVRGGRTAPFVLAGAAPIEVSGLQPDAKLEVSLQAVGSGAAGAVLPAAEKTSMRIDLFSLTSAANKSVFDTRQVTDGVYDLVFELQSEKANSLTLKTRIVVCNSTALENYLPQLLEQSGVTGLSRVVVLGQPLGHIRLIKPLGGSIVAGELSIECGGVHDLVIKQLDVTLVAAYKDDGADANTQPIKIYAGTTLPDSLVFDTTQIADGAYDLVLSITLIDGKTTTIQRRISVDNWTLLQDAVEPPMNSWFGEIIRMQTEAATTGWEFTGNANDTLFGDADRIRRKAVTAESLTWNLAGLRSFAFTVYTRNPELTPAIQVALSTDDTVWTSASYTTRILEQSTTGWWKVMVEGEVPAQVQAEHIRFTVVGSQIAPSDLELGYVVLRGVSNY